MFYNKHLKNALFSDTHFVTCLINLFKKIKSRLLLFAEDTDQLRLQENFWTYISFQKAFFNHWKYRKIRKDSGQVNEVDDLQLAPFQRPKRFNNVTHV